MKKIFITFVLIASVLLCLPLMASAETIQPDNISAGETRTISGDESIELYFTPDENKGYTFTITCPNRILPTLSFESFKPYDIEDVNEGSYSYDDENDTIWFEHLDYPAKIKTQTYTCSIYGQKDISYHVNITFDNPEEGTQTTGTLKLTKTDKAGITTDGFTYVSDNHNLNWEETVTVTGYKGTNPVASIPAEIQGMRVKSVGNYAFSGNDTITDLKFPEGFQRLRNNVATGCPNLRRVKFPSTFDEHANKPFVGCRLESITFPKGNKSYSYKNGFLIELGTDAIGYYGSGTECTIPDGIRKVASKTFTGTDVTDLILPESVKRFEYQFDRHINFIHTKSSFLDISDVIRQYKYDSEAYPINIGHIYGPKGSMIEKLANSCGIDFVPEGTAEKYYAITELKSNILNGDMVSHVYIHADDKYYGKFTPSKTGDYCLIIQNGWNGDFDKFDTVKDASGSVVKMTAYERNYRGCYITLTAGQTYYFEKDGSGDELYGGEPKTDYSNRYMDVYLIRRDIMYPEDYAGTKLSQPMKVSGKTVSIKYKTLRKKAQTVAAKKAYTIKKKQGKLSYTLSAAKKSSKNFKKYFKINKKTGKITVKKGLKKGLYKVTIKIKAAGNSRYKAGTKKAVVKIKVK